MEFKSNLRGKPRIDIISMIDVIFFLLVFFMLFTTFKTTPYGLEIKLPQSTTAAKNEDQSISINIDKNGSFIYEDRIVLESELLASIKEKQSSMPHVVAIINADKDTPYSYVVKAIDIVREGGIFRITFGVELKRSPAHGE